MLIERAIKKVNKVTCAFEKRERECNEYFISLSLIRCQFSITGLEGPIFNHFCNVKTMCAARWSLSGHVAPLSLIFSTQIEYGRNVYTATNALPVSQNNTAYI